MPESQKDILKLRGFFLSPLDLPEAIRREVVARDWPALDQTIRKETSKGGLIFERLEEFAQFSEIEFIISIRSSQIEPDEDGIWHDDGSRVLAFSLSLTLERDAIEGGKLEVRKRSAAGEEISEVIPTPPYGTMIVFATGHQGFEHKINRVIRGERIIIAGWCT